MSMVMVLPCRSQLESELQSLGLGQQILAKIHEDRIYFRARLCAATSLS